MIFDRAFLFGGIALVFGPLSSATKHPLCLVSKEDTCYSCSDLQGTIQSKDGVQQCKTSSGYSPCQSTIDACCEWSQNLMPFNYTGPIKCVYNHKRCWLLQPPNCNDCLTTDTNGNCIQPEGNPISCAWSVDACCSRTQNADPLAFPQENYACKPPRCIVKRNDGTCSSCVHLHGKIVGSTCSETSDGVDYECTEGLDACCASPQYNEKWDGSPVQCAANEPCIFNLHDNHCTYCEGTATTWSDKTCAGEQCFKSFDDCCGSPQGTITNGFWECRNPSSSTTTLPPWKTTKDAAKSSL